MQLQVSEYVCLCTHVRSHSYLCACVCLLCIIIRLYDCDNEISENEMEKGVDTDLCCTDRNSSYDVFMKQFCVLFLFDEESFKIAVLLLSIDGEWLGNARQIWPIRGQWHALQTPGSSVTVETEVLCLGKSRLPHILQAVCHTLFKTSSKTVELSHV